MSLTEAKTSLPACPFPCIDPYSYAHRKVFFARDADIRPLTRLVVMYRGVLLYSDSGAGKSSLLNAGLLGAALDEGLQPELIKVRPQPGAEIVVHRISEVEDGKPPYLPSVLVAHEPEDKVTLSVEEFLRRVRAGCVKAWPLLIFDQFEEWVTLFETAGLDARRSGCQRRVLDALASLIQDTSTKVKILIVFREDYLAKLAPLFKRCPDLSDHYLRLAPLDTEQVYRAIRGPFETFPSAFHPELDEPLAREIQRQFADRSADADLSLTEVQIVCHSLYKSGAQGPELIKLFKDGWGGVPGTLRRYYEAALAALTPSQREAATAILARMVTSAGTRNVVSGEDLLHRVKLEEGIPTRLLSNTLRALEGTTLVHRERRREVEYYEIASEFLVEWIRDKAREHEKLVERRKVEKERHAKLKRLQTRVAALAVIVIALILGVAVLLVTYQQKEVAEREQIRAQQAERKAQGDRRRAEDAEELAKRFSQAAQKGQRLAETLHYEASRMAEGRLLLHRARSASGDPELALALSLRAVAFDSPDRGLSREALAELRSAIRGSLVRTTIAVPSAVNDVSFSPDGARLATACSDGTLRLWDPESGRQVLSRYAHSQQATAVAFSADGALLATGGSDGQVKVWDGQRLGPKQLLKGHFDEVVAVAFTADSTGLLTAGQDGRMLRWNVGTGRVLREFSVHYGEIQALAVGAAGSRAATAGEDDRIVLTDITSGRVLSEDLVRGVSRLALSWDGTKLAVGLSSGHVEILDAVSGRVEVKSFPAHSNIITDLSFSSDGSRLATAGYDGVAKVWDALTGRQILSSLGFPAQELLSRVRFSPDGRRLVTGSTVTRAGARGSGSLRVWSTTSGEELAAITRPQVTAAAITADGATVAIASGLGPVELWDATLTRQLSSFSTGRAVTAMAFSPDGRYLASTSADGKGLITDVVSGRHTSLDNDDGHKKGITHVVFSPDGALVATASRDHTAKVWVASTGALRRTLQGHTDEVLAVAFSHNGSRLATASKDKTARLWELTSSATKVLEGHFVGLLDVAFSPDDRLLATASKDKTAKLWEVATAKPLRSFEGHADVAFSVVFCPDGQQVITAGGDGTARLWDATSGLEVHRLADLGVGDLSVAGVSADGRLLALKVEGVGVFLHVLQSEDLVRLAKARMTRPLTPGECQRCFERDTCPVSGLSLAASGRDLALNLKTEKAIQALRAARDAEPALSIDPENEARQWTTPTLLTFARMAAEDDDAGGTLRALTMTASINPDWDFDPLREAQNLRARALLDRGKTLAQKGDLDPAVASLEQAVEADPDVPVSPGRDTKRLRALKLISTAFEELAAAGLDADAVQRKLEIASELQPESALPHELLGLVYQLKLDPAHAIMSYQRAVELSSRDDLLVALAWSCWSAKRYDDARRAAESALRQAPDSDAAHFVLGVTFAEQKDYRAALREYAKVQTRHSTTLDALNNSGAIYFEHGDFAEDFERAYAMFSMLTSKAPTDATFQSNLAEASLVTGRFIEAAHVSRTARTLGRSRLSPADNLAQQFIEVAALALQGQMSQANEALGVLQAEYDRVLDKNQADWSWGGTKHYIETAAMGDSQRRILRSLIGYLETPRSGMPRMQFADQ